MDHFPITKQAARRGPPETARDEADRLGGTIERFSHNSTWTVTTLIAGAGAAVSVVVVFCTLYFDQPRSILPRLAYVWGCAAAVTALTVACWYLLWTRVWVCPEGFAWVKGPWRGSTGWGEVTSIELTKLKIVERGQVDEIQHWCSLTTARGGSFALRGTGEIALVANLLAEHTVPLHLQRLRTGEAFRLNPFEVDSEGISYAGQRLPWRDIDGVVTQDNHLVIRHHGPVNWVKVPLREVWLPPVVAGLAVSLGRERNPTMRADDNPFVF